MTTESKATSVLIVDDETLVRRTIRKSLVREGYECKEAESAAAAMEALKSQPAEVVLLDIKMPGKSGRELLPEISAAFPDTSVIMATATVEPATIVECLKNGASDYITKPFKPHQIVDAIRTVLAKKKLETELRLQKELIGGNTGSNDLQHLFSGAIESLIIALEAKDKYTAGHSRRVTEIAVQLGQTAGLKETELDDLRWAALLHDIGKIGIDRDVLHKPDRLTDNEYQYVLNHASIGSGIVQPLVNANIVSIILHHHDRYNGSTPNQQIKGSDIPLGARILAIADTYDAMTSDRPYRNALPPDVAFKEIQKNSGTQFDPELAELFLTLKVPEKIAV
jgi:putative two-component system response regulator